MKTPTSSPLFDAPFTRYAEQTPLRRRENDPISSHTYGEMPRRVRLRRPLNDTERLIRWGMKGILLSPVIVLVVWSLALMLSSPKWSAAPSRSAHWSPTARTMEAPPSLPAESLDQLSPPVVGNAFDAALVRPRPQPLPRDAIVVQPPHLPLENQPIPQQPLAVVSQYQQELMAATQQNAPPRSVQQYSPMLMNAQPDEPTRDQLLPVVQPLTPQQMREPQQPTVKYYYYDPKLTKRDNAGRIILPSIVYDPLGRPVPVAWLQQDPRRTVHHFDHSNVTDSSETYERPNVIETPVHDHKRQMPYIPSLRGVHHFDLLNSTDIISNMSFFHPDVIPTPVHDHKREVGFAVPDPSTIPTDQSIIVGTVGVMALLVGALSARRLRSRGF